MALKNQRGPSWVRPRIVIVIVRQQTMLNCQNSRSDPLKGLTL